MSEQARWRRFLWNARLHARRVPGPIVQRAADRGEAPLLHEGNHTGVGWFLRGVGEIVTDFDFAFLSKPFVDATAPRAGAPGGRSAGANLR